MPSLRTAHLTPTVEVSALPQGKLTKACDFRACTPALRNVMYVRREVPPSRAGSKHDGANPAVVSEEAEADGHQGADPRGPPRVPRPPGSLWATTLLILRRPCLQEAGEGEGKATSAKHGCARHWQVLDMYSVMYSSHTDKEMEAE